MLRKDQFKEILERRAYTTGGLLMMRKYEYLLLEKVTCIRTRASCCKAESITEFLKQQIRNVLDQPEKSPGMCPLDRLEQGATNQRNNYCHQ